MVVEKFLQKVYIYMGTTTHVKNSFMYVLTSSVVAAGNWTNMAFAFKGKPPRVQRDTQNFLSTYSSWPRTTRDCLLPYPMNWIESLSCVYWERWGNNLHTTLDISVVVVGREAHILGVGVDLAQLKLRHYSMNGM
jgi:hypothetical protein